MLGEKCFDIDFNLTDILCNIDDCASVTSGKKTDCNGNLNSFNFSLTVSNIPSYTVTTGIESDASDDDLSTLLDSCHARKIQPSGLISLAALAENHFTDNLSSTSGNKPEKCLSDSFMSNLKSDGSHGIKSLDFLEDILFEEKCEDSNKILSTQNLLNSLNSEHSLEENAGKNHDFGFNEETLNDELIPDINLSFCIKKDINKNKFSSISTSAESSDSGFDEIDLSSLIITSSSSDESLSIESLVENDELKSILPHAKGSLLSRAVSAKLKPDKSQREKLRNIRSKLLMKCIPQAFSEYKRVQNYQKFEAIIDQSDQCVVTSSFLIVSDQ